MSNQVFSERVKLSVFEAILIAVVAFAGGAVWAWNPTNLTHIFAATTILLGGTAAGLVMSHFRSKA